MTRRIVLSALALLVLTPFSATAKSSDADVRAKLESAVKAMEKLLPAAEKDKGKQVQFRTALVALRSAQQARRAGKLDVAFVLARKGEAAALKGAPTLEALLKEHAAEVKLSNEKIPQDFGKLKDDWKKMGQILPDTIMDQNKILPDTIMR